MSGIALEYRVEQKNPAIIGDTCFVGADGLCIGCWGQWTERGRGNSNAQEFFCTTLYAYLNYTKIQSALYIINK